MRKTITALTLAIVMTFGATFANAGIIVAGRPAADTCTGKNGIIVAGQKQGFVIEPTRDGIIVAGFVLVARSILGIIVAGEKEESTGCKGARHQPKGIIVAG